MLLFPLVEKKSKRLKAHSMLSWGLMILSGGLLQIPTWLRYGFWLVVLEDRGEMCSTNGSSHSFCKRGALTHGGGELTSE